MRRPRRARLPRERRDRSRGATPRPARAATAAAALLVGGHAAGGSALANPVGPRISVAIAARAIALRGIGGRHLAADRRDRGACGPPRHPRSLAHAGRRGRRRRAARADSSSARARARRRTTSGTWTVRTRCSLVAAGHRRPRLRLPPRDPGRHRRRRGPPAPRHAQRPRVRRARRVRLASRARASRGSLRFTGRNAWEMSGRSAPPGTAASASRLRSRRAAARDGDAVAFRVDVLFSDASPSRAAACGSNYRYRVEPEVVRVRVDVVPLCPRGRCGHTRDARVRQGAEVRRARRRRRLHAHGDVPSRRQPRVHLRRRRRPPRADLRHRPVRRPRARAPPLRPRQRRRAAPTAGAPGRALPRRGRRRRPRRVGVWRPRPDAPAFPATRARSTASSGTARAAARRAATSGGGRRRAASRDGRYGPLGGIFPAWEGGRGGYDCEPLARPFPRGGVAFATDLTFALTRG